jgi:hypothetical protein
MDYSICQALKRFPHHVQALIIYDICCQWSLHFRQRVSESKFLELFDSLEIIGAVGKWHLAAHIPECFPKFSLNFVEGAGEVDGEILETLWSPLDEVAGLTQAMSIPHAQEVIDDHMNDSNWRKIIRMRRDRHHMHFYRKTDITSSRFTVRKKVPSHEGSFRDETGLRTVDRVFGCIISSGMDRTRTRCHGTTW